MNLTALANHNQIRRKRGLSNITYTEYLAYIEWQPKDSVGRPKASKFNYQNWEMHKKMKGLVFDEK